MGNTAQHCRLGLFQDSAFAGDLEDSKSTSGGIQCIFGSHTFLPMSWMCKKQTSVSHSSTEAEVISLDASLRMDGIPALDLWDFVIEVFYSSPNQINKARYLAQLQGNLLQSTTLNMRSQIPTKHINLDLTNVDHVSSNVKPSGSSALFYVFEDNEAVVKMIIKSWTSTMRHVSRTHRVALDWLSDRIKIQTRYIDTMHQLADILTKGNFTRDEWNNLLHLLTSAIPAPLAALRIPASYDGEEDAGTKRRGINCDKSKPTVMNLSSTVSAGSSSAKDPIASKSPVILRVSGKLDARARRSSKPDAPSSSQGS